MYTIHAPQAGQSGPDKESVDLGGLKLDNGPMDFR